MGNSVTLKNKSRTRVTDVREEVTLIKLNHLAETNSRWPISTGKLQNVDHGIGKTISRKLKRIIKRAARFKRVSSVFNRCA